jgi:hypothetical protein
MFRLSTGNTSPLEHTADDHRADHHVADDHDAYHHGADHHLAIDSADHHSADDQVQLSAGHPVPAHHDHICTAVSAGHTPLLP